jgi:hypothetical protein
MVAGCPVQKGLEGQRRYLHPACLGATYLDAGPAGQRPGSATEYDPPKYIAFHHTLLLKQGPLTANIDVHIRYTIER